MSEGSDEHIDALEAMRMPDHDFDEKVVDWIREGQRRLHERGYMRDRESVTIYVGEEIYYRMAGDYFDLRENVNLTIDGSPVFVVRKLPDYRVMLVDERAMTDHTATTGPPVMHDADPSDPGEYLRELTPTSVTKELVRHPDAIEFVPETEVLLDDV